MRNIFAIFKTDIKSLCKHFFAMAVAIAITFLPSLYAWLNIYANWDPYGNTGNISIAVASLDRGFFDYNGMAVNEGDKVVENLRSSTSINWIILDDDQEAVSGVYSGKYYAAVVFSEDFTYKMYNMLTNWAGKPSITYYENAKKNAVATKITDTAVESLKRSISSEYVHALVEKLMSGANNVSDELQDADADGTLRGMLTQANTLVSSCMRTADAFNAANGEKQKNSVPIDPAAIDALIAQNNADIAARREAEAAAGEETTQSAEAVLNSPQPQESVARINMAVYQGLDQSALALDAYEQAQQRNQPMKAAAIASGAADDMGALGDRIAIWGKGFTGTDETSVAVKETAAQLSQDYYDMQQQMTLLSASAYAAGDTSDVPPSASPIPNVKDEIDAISENINELNATLTPTMESLGVELDNVINEAASVMDNMRGLSAEAQELRAVAGVAAASLEETINLVRPVLQSSAAKLSDKLHSLNTLDGDAYLELLVNLLGGDPELYGEYFSQMVQTEVNQAYPIENYGSAMTPFYSVLAIWVGGVILAAILKTHAETEGLVNPRSRELFFGRYLLFFVMSQLQTAIIILGDLLILKIQCLYPGLLFLTGFITSFTFSLLIYALALSFGDVGKAIVVVIMVLQIAGSSGTFPIELLPTVYQKVYRFFPFPYAINAMRECICGLYGNDLLEQLLKLLIFAAVALGIGLLVRRPFIGLTNYMEEKLEETELF